MAKFWDINFLSVKEINMLEMLLSNDWCSQQPLRMRSVAKLQALFVKDQFWVVVSNIFYFHPYLGKWSNLTNIFELGWNHQLELVDQIFVWTVWSNRIKPRGPVNINRWNIKALSLTTSVSPTVQRRVRTTVAVTTFYFETFQHILYMKSIEYKYRYNPV